MSVVIRDLSAVLSRIALLGALALLMLPAGALAHGDESAGAAADVKELSLQPARVLAQQALASLLINGDKTEAGIRLDAALESTDKSEIDVHVLRQATETLDGGDPEGAIPLLDRALSFPPGSSGEDPLHAAGREFRPAFGTAEVVGIVLGSILLLIGGLALWRGRERQPVAELES